LKIALGGVPADVPKFFVLGNHDRAYGLVEPDAALSLSVQPSPGAASQFIWHNVSVSCRGQRRMIQAIPLD